jgi:two-component system, cell cycle sensor histidine kinase and response regulator CckA
MLRRLIGEDVQLVTRLEDGLWNVRADAGQLEQVVVNLAVNARDAMPRGGTLSIETMNVRLDGSPRPDGPNQPPGDYVMLVVSDNGIGMDAETKAHIFEPFFTTKGVGKGTGLGLATVYGIVKQSSGFVWAYSEKGFGSAFKIYLPRVRAAPAALAEPPSRRSVAEPVGGSETVLLAEDEDAVRGLTRRLLERIGYRVLEARDGRSAIAVLSDHSEPIDVLLSDLVMPDVSGTDLANEVRAVRPDVKVLFMSGYTEDAVVRHGLGRDLGHFLQKPFSAEALARKLREVIEGRLPDAAGGEGS